MNISYILINISFLSYILLFLILFILFCKILKCILMCFNGQVAHSVVEHSHWSSPTQRMSSTTIDSLAIRSTALLEKTF